MARAATHARLSVRAAAGCCRQVRDPQRVPRPPRRGRAGQAVLSLTRYWFAGSPSRLLSAGAQKEVCAQGVAESKTLPSTPARAANVAAAAVTVAGTDERAVPRLGRTWRAEAGVQADLVGGAIVRRAVRTDGSRCRPGIRPSWGKSPGQSGSAPASTLIPASVPPHPGPVAPGDLRSRDCRAWSGYWTGKKRMQAASLGQVVSSHPGSCSTHRAARGHRCGCHWDRSRGRLAAVADLLAAGCEGER